MDGPPVLILDNGAYEIKAGFSGLDLEPRVFPNSIARSRAEKKVYVSDEISECRDLSGLAYRRPFERGMLVNWDAEKIVWDRVFSPAGLSVNPQETSLLVTEPYFNLPNIAETYDQMVFEEWEFASFYRCTPAALIPYGGLFEDESDPAPPECAIVVDAGYSYTHVIPLRDGQIVWEHVKRIDIGGKLLTNHLKHLISFRQWNMSDETAVVNAVREACGYVSMDWKRDLEACKRNPRKNPIVQEYVLPDFSPKSTSRTGYIRSGPNAEAGPSDPAMQAAAAAIAAASAGSGPPGHGASARGGGAEDEEEQVLWMGNERFAGPELLFHPSDIGLKQTGLPETIAHVIAQMPPELQGMYWAHIGISGGLGNIEALGERLERDLRALCPTQYDVGIFESFEPTLVPYQSALSLTSSDIYLSSFPVTRAEYLEHGSSICRRRFGGPRYNPAIAAHTGGDGAAAGGGEDDDGDDHAAMEIDEDERERRYALGIESIRKKGQKGKRRVEEEEVTSGNWGGRRRRDLA